MKTLLLLFIILVFTFFPLHAQSTAEVISIKDARERDSGTEVAVAGRVTTAGEFDGPVYMQDGTAGISVFFSPLHDAVEIGDSIRVTGLLGEFNTLVQITGNGIDFEVFSAEKRLPEPKIITILEMNSGDYESQLIQLNEASIQYNGIFSGDTNYPVSDATGSSELRIDRNTDLPGVRVRPEPITVTGVAGRFQGQYQLLPRFVDDLDMESFSNGYTADDVPKDQTFDVVTWNIEWFGDTEGRGPNNKELQLQNVKTIIETIDADLFAVQEIADEDMFNRLLSELEEYSGFLAGYSWVQKTGYIFKTTTIDSLDSGLLSEGQNSFDWAGRFPLKFKFTATIQDETRTISSFNVHAKAQGDQGSWERRTRASEDFKQYLDTYPERRNEIFLGDYNDDVVVSTYNNEVSPYLNFVNDQNYKVITKTLSDRGEASFSTKGFHTMLDHITVSENLILDHWEDTERIEIPDYVNNYHGTTSDHYPVWTRFDFTREFTSSEGDITSDHPEAFKLEQNYPNPFNPTTSIQFELPSEQQVTLRVYDIMGRLVATLSDNQSFSAGTHRLQFDASQLSSGVYLYRMQTGNGHTLSGKMMLVK